MLETLLNLLHRFRTVTLIAALLAMVVAMLLASRLSVNDSPERWLPASSVADWDRFAEHFEYSDTIAIGIQFHREIRDDDLKFLKQFRKDLLAVEAIKQVIDVSVVADQIEGVPLTALLGPPIPDEEDPYNLYRGTLFNDPALQGKDAPPGRTLLDFVMLESVDGVAGGEQQDELDTGRRNAVAGIYEVFQKHDHNDITFHMVGGVVIQDELEGIARRLVVTILPASLLLTLVALGLGFRSLGSVAIAMVGGVWSVAIMLGGVSIAGWSLNVVTTGGPTLMVVIVLATTIHISHYYSHRDDRSEGHGRPAHFIRWVAVPCLGAAAVTGVGFLMLAFNELSPARELGIELFFGAVLAFFGAFLMWLLLAPLRTAPGKMLSPSALGTLKRYSVARPRTTVLTILAALAFLAYTSTWVRVDADPFSFFQPKSRIAKSFTHFADCKFGLYIVDIVLIPKGPSSEAQRRAVVEFENRIAKREEVRKAISTATVQERAPAIRSLRSLRRWGAYKMVFKDWTADLNDCGALRVSFMVYDNGEGFRPLLKEIREAAPTDDFDWICAGTAVNVEILAEHLVGGITRGLITALVIMAALCAILFRSIRLTLISVLPNTLPVLVVFGLMGLCDIPLNSGSAMVTTIALGVGLNDTVHFVMHYRRRRTAGEDVDEALADTFAEVGRPIVLTSVINCVGFGIFLLSDFRPLYHFGMLASMAMAAALLGDLLLLPNLLKLFDREAGGKVHEPAPNNKTSPKEDSRKTGPRNST